MKIEETYEFWCKYIKNNKIQTLKTKSNSEIEVLATEMAEYKDLYVLKSFNHVYFIKNDGDLISSINESRWHRLDGPARISKDPYFSENQYWIDDFHYTYEEFVHKKIDIMIKEALSCG